MADLDRFALALQRGEDHLDFGPDYILPKPFDVRLVEVIPPAVARAAVASGVARAEWPEHYPPL